VSRNDGPARTQQPCLKPCRSSKQGVGRSGPGWSMATVNYTDTAAVGAGERFKAEARKTQGVGLDRRHTARVSKALRRRGRFCRIQARSSETLQALRAAQALSQVDVAKLLRSGQSRAAKMEASDPSVSIDLLVRSLLRLGVQPGDIAKALLPPRRSRHEKSRSSTEGSSSRVNLGRRRDNHRGTARPRRGI
jgi:transcriptional regulator with XRE-family HTH domain